MSKLENATNLALIGGLLSLGVSALTFRVRQEAIHQYGGLCHGEGPHAGGLEAAHINHEKNDYKRKRMGLPPYNSPEAVEILCTADHIRQHEENEGRNGLSLIQNRWAITTMRKKLNSL